MKGIELRTHCALGRLGLVLAWTLCGSLGVSSAATGVPVFSETRTYENPAPGPGRFFGFPADISSRYVGVLGGQITNFAGTEYNAFVFDAATGQHLWTLTQPVPPENVNFRFASIAIDGDVAVIGATYAHVALPSGGTAPNAGAAYVYDLATGQLKHALVSDRPQDNFLLGASVDILGDKIAVGSWGNAYVFDVATGAQLAKLNPSTPSEQFGISVALSETAVVVGANSDRSRGEFTGAAFAFDASTYAEISKFVPTDAASFDNFGINVAVDGRYAIGSGQRGAYVFDMIDGSQMSKLTLPNSSSTFPNLVDIRGKIALLGDPAIGRAATFDWTTGAALQTLAPGNSPSGREFGSSVAIVGRTGVVGAMSRTYQFEVIPEPSGAALAFFGLAAAYVCTALRGRPA